MKFAYLLLYNGDVLMGNVKFKDQWNFKTLAVDVKFTCTKLIIIVFYILHAAKMNVDWLSYNIINVFFLNCLEVQNYFKNI